MKLNKDNIWFIIEKVPDANYVMLYPICVDYGKHLKKQGAGDYLRQLLMIVKNGVAELCYVKSEFDKATEFIVSKAIKNISWLEKVNRKTELFAKQYLVFAKSLLNLNSSQLSDRDLIKRLNRLLYFQIRSHGYGQATTWLIDAGEQFFSNYLLTYLKNRIKEKKLSSDLASIFSILTSPLKPSSVEIENQESLKLAQKISKDKVAKRIFNQSNFNELETKLKPRRPNLLNKLKNHHKRWFWLHYNYRGPVLELNYFLQIWQGLIKEGKINQYSKEAEIKFSQLKKAQKKILKQLNLDLKHKKLFTQARYIVWIKGYRKDCMYFSAYVTNQLLKEIARRLFISFNQVEFMSQDEHAKALLKKKFDTKELDQRFKFSVIYGGWDKTQIFSGDKAKAFLKKLKWEKEERKKVDKLIGQPASPGKARGVVKIVETVDDIPKMNKGDIMLSETTYPALVPAMRKAGAIVTNVGGLTCHAAIVSRELKIPCVVGTKIATKVLKDGDRVEVDATRGTVKKL